VGEEASAAARTLTRPWTRPHKRGSVAVRQRRSDALVRPGRGRIGQDRVGPDRIGDRIEGFDPECGYARHGRGRGRRAAVQRVVPLPLFPVPARRFGAPSRDNGIGAAGPRIGIGRAHRFRTCAGPAPAGRHQRILRRRRTTTTTAGRVAGTRSAKGRGRARRTPLGLLDGRDGGAGSGLSLSPSLEGAQRGLGRRRSRHGGASKSTEDDGRAGPEGSGSSGAASAASRRAGPRSGPPMERARRHREENCCDRPPRHFRNRGVDNEVLR
jgi:hypothetical protein